MQYYPDQLYCVAALTLQLHRENCTTQVQHWNRLGILLQEVFAYNTNLHSSYWKLQHHLNSYVISNNHQNNKGIIKGDLCANEEFTCPDSKFAHPAILLSILKWLVLTIFILRHFIKEALDATNPSFTLWKIYLPLLPIPLQSKSSEFLANFHLIIDYTERKLL